MGRSFLQEPFLREVAATFQATRDRITRRLTDDPSADPAVVIDDELRGLYHGLFVIFDGGSALANEGMVQIMDEDGVPFDRFLHEISFRHWPSGQS